MKRNKIKPEVEDIKPFCSFSESAQHSKSLVVGHTPDIQIIIIITQWFLDALAYLRS